MVKLINQDCLAVAVIFIAATILFLTAPQIGDFSWPESPRNALDGAFVLDLVKEHPFHDPVGWAERYYYQYPALTILFYPPLLHACLAVFYAIFGVGHASALACVAVFSFVLALGLYVLARRIMPPAAALATSLLMFAAPEFVKWSQQVMLEIPMMALGVWASFFMLRYMDTGKWQHLLISATFILAAAYTKQIALIIGLAMAVTLVVSQGWRDVLSRRHVWLVAIYLVFSLVPLAILLVKFGKFNIAIVVEHERATINRLSLEGLFWYADKFPKMLGYPLFTLAALGVLGCAFIKAWRPLRNDFLLYASWLIIGYMAMTAIDTKEVRHGLYLAVPLVVVAGLCLHKLLGAFPGAGTLLPVVSVVLLAITLLTTSTPRIGGYNAAANYIVSHAPPNARVLFVGNQDGSFIFNVRAHEERRDISIIRADKIFLNVAMNADWGLHPRDYSFVQVERMLDDLAISYVVTIPRMWAKEAVVMEELSNILESEHFQEVARVVLDGNTGDKELLIYKNNATLPEVPASYNMELKAFGINFRSTQ